MTPEYVDFHCHLDLFPDPQSAVRAAEAEGIYTLTVTTTPKAWPRNHELTRDTRHVRAALGLHPQLVAERGHEIALWEEYLPHARYVGEVGLDAGPRYYRSLDLQKQIFTRVLQKCAEAGGKILTVHSVRAATTVLDLIESHLNRQQSQIVLHWFTGSKSEAHRAIDLGCYFSINTAMLRNDRGCSLVAMLPSDRLLTETDAPFTRINDRPTSPKDIKSTVEMLAALFQKNPGEMAHTISSNLRVMLRAAGIADSSQVHD
jgi:TatD DNase family protein